MRITVAVLGPSARWIGTHKDPGTPQAQGQSVPTVWTWVKTNAHAYEMRTRVGDGGRVGRATARRPAPPESIFRRPPTGHATSRVSHRPG